MSTEEILSSVGCASVAELRKAYLDVLKKLNERDKPHGFDTWESYHRHVEKLRTFARDCRDNYDCETRSERSALPRLVPGVQGRNVVRPSSTCG